jgi:mono/diheme cytochrome c family protein
MKKCWILLCMALAVAGFFFGSCTSRKSEPITGKKLITDNARIANGEMMFMANCQKCHPNGEGGLAPAINSNPAPGFVKRFQMRHGLGVMPSFKKEEISKKDLRDISRYLAALKH